MIQIRPMAASDLEAVLAIAAVSREAPVWTRSDYSLYLDGEPGPNPQILRAGFVAQAGSGGEPAPGFACATLLRDGEEDRAELDTLAVLPGARRQGVGAALVEAVLAWATGEGARRVSLEVRASNTAALALYGRFSFALEGRRPRYYGDPEEDALLLGRLVTRGSTSGPISTENAVEGGPPRC